jgi:hypothetical protein
MPAAAPQADFPQTCFLPPEARPIGTAAGVIEDEQGGVCFLYGWANGRWDHGDDLLLGASLDEAVAGMNGRAY